jgi:gliding motility associated protien GldN
MKKAFRYVLAIAFVSSLVTTAEAQRRGNQNGSNAAAPAQETAPPPAPVVVDPFQPATFEATPGYNPHSVRPIHESNVMYKMGLWRRINLKHKPNTPFFAEQNEITRLIIDAVKDGRLTAYKNDSLTYTMTREEFAKRLIDTRQEAPAADQPVDEFFQGTAVAAQAPVVVEFTPKQLYLLDLKEDLIFDKQRSRVYYDIQTITIVLPAEYDLRGVENQVASFRFKDLVKVFNENPNAKWYNIYNRAQDKRLSDAFELRLFHSHITKMSDPQGRDLATIYNTGAPNSGLIAAQRKEHAIVEWENDLWDY